MKTIIPGHIRAYTLWLFLVLAVVAIVKTREWSTVLGLFFLIFGIFLGDQATHLAQMDHSDVPPTWLERQQQEHRYVFLVVSLVMAVVGLTMIIK